MRSLTTSQRMAVAAVGIIALCGCSTLSSLRSGGTSSPPKESRPTGLVKPKILEPSDGTLRQAQDERGKSESGPERDESRSAQESSEPSRPQEPGNELAASRRPGLQEARSADSARSGASSETRKPEPIPAPDASTPDSKTRPGTDESKIAADSKSQGAGKSSDAKDRAFKPHDHSKYVRKITAKARQLVKKTRSSKHAFLCQDNITGEWTLALYFVRGNRYSFKVMVWDGISGKWDQSFVSGKRPIKRLKRHLTVSTSGRKCRVLKGTGFGKEG